MKIHVVLGVTTALLLARTQDPQKEALRAKLKDTTTAGAWIYDDLAAGFALAKKSNKPMLVVFR